VSEEGSLLQLPIDSLQANPLQPRGVITNTSLNELIESVKEHGVLEPLVAAHTPAGYQLIAGERRWRAAKLAGLEKVPVIVKKTTPKGMLEMAIVENVQRSDLNAIDRAKAFERLMSEFNLGTHDIAKRVSKSDPYVSNTLKLLSLPDALTDGLLSGVISEGHARALSSIPDTKGMIEAFNIIKQENGSVRRAEELARRYKNSQKTPEEKRNLQPQQLILSEELDRMQSGLEKSLGSKSKISLKQSKRETKIQIVFKGKPDITQAKLEAVYKVLSSLELE